MKKIFILFSTILLIISLGGCSMFINRKAIAEKALQEQYGEEFVAYHTWDHGGDSFRASMYPKDDESIKFNTHIFNDGRIIIDYYAEKIVGKEIIEIIKPYIDEIAEESAYFATVPIQDLGYTSKEEVSIEDFYTRAEKDESDWPFIDICINNTVVKKKSYEEEYEVLKKILNDESFNVLTGIKFTIYFVDKAEFEDMKKYFYDKSVINSTIEQVSGYGKNFSFKNLIPEIGITLDEYIQKRKEIEENE